MEEREWVKVRGLKNLPTMRETWVQSLVRGQGCRARVCMGPGESVNPLSLSSLLHKVGAAPPPAQSSEEQRRPTGPCGFVGGWRFGSPQSHGIGGWVSVMARGLPLTAWPCSLVSLGAHFLIYNVD